jgi:outer membrane protein assembly factor BamB
MLAIHSCIGSPSGTGGPDLGAVLPPGGFSWGASRALAQTPATVSAGHLYVDDAVGNAVVEFPLNAKGLPAKSSDRRLTGFNSPLGIAIGPDGDLYVADSGNDAVKVFLPGSSGAAPVRMLNVPGQPEWVAVDPRGFLAVIINNVYVLVYQPNASGNDQPILKISSRLQQAVAYDSASELYYMNEVGVGVVLPAVLPTVRWIFPTRREGQFLLAMTIRDDEAYIEVYRYRQEVVRVAALPAHSRGTPKPDRVIWTPACHGSPSGPAPLSYGLAVYKGHLFESCADSGQVYVFDALRGGTQQPIVSLSAGFTSSVGVAIGP